MAGQYDYDFLMSLADHMNFTQWIDDNFHESTSEFDLTDMNLLDNFIKPEEHIDRLGSPSDFLEDSDFVGMSPEMASQPSAVMTTVSESSVEEFKQLSGLATLDDDVVTVHGSEIIDDDFGGVSTSTTLTPAAQSLRVDGVEPGLPGYKQEVQPVQAQVQENYQLQPQYQLPVQVQDHAQPQYQGCLQSQVPVEAQPPPHHPLLQQTYTYPNPYMQGNYPQPINYHSQVITPSQPDQPQPQAAQYHYHTTTPILNPNPQPARPNIVYPTTRLPIEQPPKKYRSPAQPTAQNNHQAWLVPKLEHYTRQYQGYINNPNAAKGIESVFLSLSHPPDTATTTRPSADLTFPRTTQEYRGRVRQMFEAICDWSSPREWRAKMGHTMAQRWIEQVKTDRKSEVSDLNDEDFAPPPHLMPPVEEQWKNVIHRHLSDIEIELLSAKILVSSS